MSATPLPTPMEGDGSPGAVVPARSGAVGVVAWAQPLIIPVVAYLGSRLMVLAAAGLATWIHPTLRLSQVLDGWDGGWFLGIAAHGYPASLAAAQQGGRWAFFPGLPGVLKGVESATGLSSAHTGEATALVLGLTGVLAVWLAVREVMGSAVADRTAVLLCFFPAAYVLSMPYSEGLFLTGAGLCLYFLERRAWLAAGLAASLATLARDPGIVLVGVCLVAAVREMAGRRSWRPLAAVVSAPLGLAGWTIMQWLIVGNPVAFLHAEGYWGQGIQWFGEPLQNLWHLVSSPASWSQANEVLGGLSMLFVLLTVGLMVWSHMLRRPIPLTWWLYTAGGILVALSTHWGGSVPRFVMVVFPLLAVAAAALPRRAGAVVVPALAMLEAGLAVVAFTTIATWQTAPFAP